MIQFRDTELVNERLELTSKTEHYYLGHHLTLRNCTLVIGVPASALTIARTRLIDCSIEVKKPLKHFRWDEVFVKGCRFTGTLSGNDFGRWPDSEAGGIEDCDFTGAQLDGCRFIGCDASTLRFPSWPCFTVLDPARRSRELAALPWPGQVGIVVGTFSQYPPSTAAVTFSATRLAKESGATEDELRKVLEQVNGVKL
ncbi:hypothetical protein [Pyxidicoccus sp. MSG2]|uniref:hypothetical protein n=1 Tax=Pyxidicoccus sp. MSG2 TaxID=2996790 RepID=UPI00226DB04C|nr:hypothetical protein [Pyxidicoccus sp. MSG2]MCY1021522.1 hypothetical protein [Pyxidicoccus sp. MSG2]